MIKAVTQRLDPRSGSRSPRTNHFERSLKLTIKKRSRCRRIARYRFSKFLVLLLLGISPGKTLKHITTPFPRLRGTHTIPKRLKGFHVNDFRWSSRWMLANLFVTWARPHRQWPVSWSQKEVVKLTWTSWTTTTTTTKCHTLCFCFFWTGQVDDMIYIYSWCTVLYFSYIR